MCIQELCGLPKAEFIYDGYEYGFYLKEKFVVYIK